MSVGGLLSLGNLVYKFWEPRRGVNRDTMERLLNWLALKFWAIFGEILIILAKSEYRVDELVRRVFHLWVVGVGCKIG